MKSLTMMNGFIVCPVVFCFFFIACSSGRDKAKQAKPAKHTVEIRDMKFQPAELVVNSGDTVVWINNDLVAHDVTEEHGKAWSSSLLASGESWSMTITKSADYYCSIHVVMKGKLTVQ